MRQSPNWFTILAVAGLIVLLLWQTDRACRLANYVYDLERKLGLVPVDPAPRRLFFRLDGLPGP
jgi:hypothetical protein